MKTPAASRARAVLSVSVLCFAVLIARAEAGRAALGIGTSGQGTLTYSLGSAVAGLLSNDEGMRTVVQPQSGTGVMLPLVNQGELDLGFASAVEVSQAYSGSGEFRRRNDSLRIIARLFTTRVGLMVRSNSDLYRVSDLAGSRIAYGYSSTPVLREIIDAILAAGGLSSDDVRLRNVPSLIRGADDLASGSVDAAFFALGAGKVSEVDASVGGIRFLALEDSAEALARMQAVLPMTYLSTADAAESTTGVDRSIMVMGYDYLIFGGAHLPEDTVYSITRAVAENKDELASAFGGFEDLDPSMMGTRDYGIPFHSGAVKYYRETDLWSE